MFKTVLNTTLRIKQRTQNFNRYLTAKKYSVQIPAFTNSMLVRTALAFTHFSAMFPLYNQGLFQQFISPAIPCPFSKYFQILPKFSNILPFFAPQHFFYSFLLFLKKSQACPYFLVQALIITEKPLLSWCFQVF